MTALKNPTPLAPSGHRITTPSHPGLHILLIHQSFAALGEAGGTRHHELARFLVSQGDMVTIITSPLSYLTGKTQAQAPRKWITREELEPGITILRTHTYAAANPSFFQRVRTFTSFMWSSFFAALGVADVDLVWGTSPPIFQGITAWMIARLKRTPFLFEVRDLWPAFAIQVGVLRQPVLIWASEKLERFLYRRADRVIVNSPGFIQHVRERGARQVDLIPNGADPEMFVSDDSGAAFRRAHQLGDDFIAMYAGAHGLSNDLPVVLQAAALLRDTPQVRIVFLGDGKQKKTLQDQARQNHLDNVLFLDAVPKTEMGQALAAADACIAILKPIPLYATTYPNKVFDYMAAGRPVILAIDGVIRQVVETSGAGIAVPPGDPAAMAAAIRRLAALPDRGRSLGLAGKQAIEKDYSRSKLAQDLYALLHEMRSPHGR
jgi:glycosyltransferase involved in cell wall biosynthesis